jgi:hypothetical protein
VYSRNINKKHPHQRPTDACERWRTPPDGRVEPPTRVGRSGPLPAATPFRMVTNRERRPLCEPRRFDAPRVDVVPAEYRGPPAPVLADILVRCPSLNDTTHHTVASSFGMTTPNTRMGPWFRGQPRAHGIPEGPLAHRWWGRLAWSRLSPQHFDTVGCTVTKNFAIPWWRVSSRRDSRQYQGTYQMPPSWSSHDPTTTWGRVMMLTKTLQNATAPTSGGATPSGFGESV